VPLDAELFKQALLNLFLNAGQAMPEGGELILQACVEAENWARLDVIDTGCGIAPELREKMFRPFHTTKPGGNGLGLPTVKRIIEAHGGTIDVQSTPGHGTKFAIRIPIQRVN
jgi:signal transduction histidine kinase